MKAFVLIIMIMFLIANIAAFGKFGEATASPKPVNRITRTFTREMHF